jgi:hypothetical protein
VRREYKSIREVGYKLVAIDGELCILGFSYSNITFRVTSIELYFTLTTQIEDIIELVKQLNANSKPLELKRNLLRKRGRPCKELANIAINYKHFL